MSATHGKRQREVRATVQAHRSEFVDPVTKEAKECWVRIDNAVLESPAYLALSDGAARLYPYVMRRHDREAWRTGVYREPDPFSFGSANVNQHHKTAGLRPLDIRTVPKRLAELERHGFVELIHPAPVPGKRRSGKAPMVRLSEKWRTHVLNELSEAERIQTMHTSDPPNIANECIRSRSCEMPTRPHLRVASEGVRIVRPESVIKDHEVEITSPSDTSPQNLGTPDPRTAPSIDASAKLAPPSTCKVSLPLVRGRVAHWINKAGEHPIPETVAQVADWVYTYPGGFENAEHIANEILARGGSIDFCREFAERLGVKA